GWFGGPGLAGTGGFFESLGFRPGRTHALLAGLSEFLGGLLLALGLFTPLGAALVIAVMVAAVGSGHLPKGFWDHHRGHEFNLLVIAAATALAFVGPGEYAVQPTDPLGVEHWKLGLAALVLGLVLGGGALMSRRPVAAAHGT